MNNWKKILKVVKYQLNDNFNQNINVRLIHYVYNYEYLLATIYTMLSIC